MILVDFNNFEKNCHKIFLLFSLFCQIKFLPSVFQNIEILYKVGIRLDYVVVLKSEIINDLIIFIEVVDQLQLLEMVD